MGKNYVENSLKRFLKRKVKITMGVVVSFLITGMVSFGAADKTVEITLGNGKIEISQEIGALEGSTWTNDDIINVKDGNGVQITGENEKLNIVNNGIISGNISNGEVLGNGIITGVINKNENIQIIPTNLGTINNIGIILGNGAGGFSGNGIFIYSEDVNNTDEGIKNEINNIGIISGNGTEGSFSGNGITHYVAMIKAIVNTGIISGNGTGEGSGNGVLSNGISLEEIKNIGIISGNGTGELSGNGIVHSGTVDKTKTEIKIKNIGIILGKNSNKGYGIYDVDTGADDEKKISNITNYGIIAGSSKATEGINDDKIINKGLLINGAGTDNILVKAGEGGKLADKFIINTIEKNNAFEKLENEEALTSKKIAEKLGKADTETTFENLILNGYGTALKVDGKLSLNSSIINGGVDGKSSAVKGNGNNDTFTLSGESVINGKVDLGAGNDNLTIDNTVQINGDLDGGIGGEIEGDTLTFNNSSNENMNVLHNISNFENINVDSNITLFENIKISGAEKITIEDKGTLTLRVNGTEKDSEGKVIGHALHGNDGTIITSISPDKNGKLDINFIGGQNNEIISFGSNKLENVTVDFTNPLYMTKETSDKDSTSEIQVSVAENLDDFIGGSKQDAGDIDAITYEKLNKIYESMHSVDGLLPSEFTGLTDETVGEFLKYLHDIYAANPYAYSSELSRKTMSMMKNLADKDLNPELNKWAIYGGLTHTDGGTENSYYGKGYYTYDIGSRDISADTKISGGYFKAEYGKSDTVTTGIIFGGNNSETEIGASKVEGDSFYFGTYAKKYLNNFRFTFGAGFEHGDYKADRVAVGYEGITETRKFSENYHDRGFNIYGNTKYSKELGNNFFFEPSVTLEYSYVDQDVASEDGVLAIETDSKTFDYMTGTLNLDLRKEINKDKFTHSLTAGVSYERMLSGYDEEYITGRMKGGTDFDILVPEKEKDIFSLNAKYELETEKGFIFDVKGSYRFEHDTDKDEWIVGTGIGYKF